jgi:predicted transcriptional regulator
MPPEGSWIKYQLDLRNIKMEAVAKKANRSLSTVSRVVCRLKNSKRVERVLAEMLGYVTFDDLMDAVSV